MSHPALFALPLAAWERDGLKSALAGAHLPNDDVEAAGHFFWRFELGDVPAGFGGLEMHGDDALLRSVVTLPPLRRRGVGRGIVDVLEIEARARGARRAYLLTTDSALVFARLGYAPCPRDSVPAPIRATPLFATLCPASATAMTKDLES